MSRELKMTVEVPIWMKDAHGLRTQPYGTLTLAYPPSPDDDWMIELRAPAIRQHDNTLAVWVSTMDLEKAFAKVRGK